MLANMLFTSITFYGAFTWVNPPWTLLSLVEFVCVVTITCIGFTKVYNAAGGDKNSSFPALFNCLSFGIWFWTTLIVWAIYWGVVGTFRYGLIAAYRFERMALAENLAAIGGSFEWLWTFMAAVLWQAFFFAWLVRVIPRTRSDA